MSTVPPGRFDGAEPAPLVTLPPVVRVGAGSTSAVQVTVTNLAAEPRELLVLAVGVDQAWLRGPVRTRVLAPGESEQVALPLAPSAGTLPAEYPLAVTVQAVVPATGRASEAPTGLGETSVVVNPRAQLTFEVAPERATLFRSRAIRATLRNTGAVPATVELRGTGTQGLLVTLRKREVTVPPGAVATVRGRLVAARPRRVGSPLVHAWSISATSPEIVRQVRGTARQRALFGAGLTKAVALIAVVAVWAAAVLVLVQEVPKRIQEADEASQAAGESGDDGGAGGSDGGAGGAGGAGPGGKIEVTRAAATDAPSGLQIAGSVDTPDPAGVTVSVEAVSLASEEVESADNVDEVRTAAAETGAGKLSPSSFVLRLPERKRKRDPLHTCSDLGECTATTTDDGAWSIADVKPTGYYLVTFRKPGLVSQSHLVDAANFDPTEPLEVVMEPGDGALSGTVRTPGGLLGGATVTVSDGTSTITTSTASSGPRQGRWEVSGLDTPATYSVQVSSFGLGTESLLADLQEDEEKVLDVTMKPGVALVSGTVKGRDAGNRQRRLGGVAVTVTDDEGNVRTATTATDRDQLGFFSLAGVPAPGDYVVTLSAPGYQTQTRNLTIGDDEGAARVDASLELATGGVSGIVTDDDGDRVVDAGLTLSDGVNTYKTTPRTDRGYRGRFSFAGVEPGLYRLTTERYLFRTSVLTVEVTPGEPKRVDPVLRELDGSTIPATSTIQGGAVTAGTGEPVACDPGDPAGNDCIEARVFNSGTDASLGDPVQVGGVSRFGPGGEYLLPGQEPDGGAGALPAGLEPGLYVVEVRAPHYETARKRVPVGQDEKVVADTIELEKAPKITGLLSAVADAPATDRPTCVWAVSSTTDLAGSPLPACADTTAAQCPAGASSYEDDELTDDRVCAKVTGSGTYTVEVPRRGEYLLVVDATDEEYLDPDPQTLSVPAGSTLTRNVELTRYGRLVLDVRTPSPDGGIVDAVSPQVVFGTGSSRPVIARGNELIVTQLRPGVPYSLKVVSQDGTRETRAISATVDLNNVDTRTVVLRPTIDSFYFRVTTSYLGTTQPVASAPLTATGPYEYSNLDVTTADVSATTNTQGCVLLSRTPATRATTGPNGECTAASYTDASARSQDFMFDKINQLKVTSPGFRDLVLTNTRFATGTLLNELALEPVDVGFTGTITGSPDDRFHPMFGARFRVESNGTVVPGVTVSSDWWGNLTWNDSRLGRVNRIVPGVYTVTASLDGYESDSITIRCTADTDGAVDKTCGPRGSGSDTDEDGVLDEASDRLDLVQLGSLTVRAEDSAGDPVNNALVTLIDSADSDRVVAQQQSANTNNVVTFTGLAPSVASYKVRVQAPAFETEPFPTPGALTCDGSAVTRITVPAGRATDCTASLKRLGTFTGTVTGRLGSSTNTRALSGATVSAVPCATVKNTRTDGTGTDYCTAVTGSRRLTVNAAADGTYSLTGNAQIAGITAEHWLVTTTLPGWSQPALSADVLAADAADSTATAIVGTLVDVTTGGDIPLDLSMDVNRVTYTVTLSDQGGLKVNKATIRMMQGDTEVARVSGVPTAVTDGRYVFTNVVPGQYALEVSGGFLITSTVPVEVAVGTPSQGYPVYASKAINTVKGSVAATDVTGGLEGAKVEIVACSGGTCTGPAAEGTNDQRMEVVTDASGTYQFRNVPNGTYAVRFTKLGYAPQTSAGQLFDHSLGSVPDVSATLAPYQQVVDVEIETSTASADLTGAALSLTAVDVDGNLAGTKNTTVTGKNATFGQVRFGCWTVALTLPADHFGDKTYPASSTNSALACTSNAIVKPEAPSGPLVLKIKVVETELVVRLASATALAGHTAPTSAEMRVFTGGTEILNDPAFAVGATRRLWVKPGSYHALATVTTPSVSPQFWTPVAIDRDVTASNGPVDASLALAESTGQIKVKVVGASAAQPAKLTITPGPGQTAPVPAAYAAPIAVTSAADRTLTLPGGRWLLVANYDAAGSTAFTRDYNVDRIVLLDTTIELTPTPPPTP